MSANLKRKLILEKVPNKKKNRRKIEKSLEEKSCDLLNAVRAQGPLGNLVIISQDASKIPYSKLKVELNLVSLSMDFKSSDVESDNFSVTINNEEFVSGTFQHYVDARKDLTEKAIEKLKDTCFCITKKSDYFNVTKENLCTPISGGSNVSQMTNMNSTAHKMMTRMGWTGGGLGVQEQGIVNSVTLCENVNRAGFGHYNITKEVTKKLRDFSKSSDLLTLVFNDDFTIEDRKLIHRIAARFNLKSKSSGGVSRKLAVSKKLTRMDIVQELLKKGGEDGLYKLHIPRNYEHMWH